MRIKKRLIKVTDSQLIEIYNALILDFEKNYSKFLDTDEGKERNEFNDKEMMKIIVPVLIFIIILKICFDI